jgi:hypothetical protein
LLFCLGVGQIIVLSAASFKFITYTRLKEEKERRANNIVFAFCVFRGLSVIEQTYYYFIFFTGMGEES